MKKALLVVLFCLSVNLVFAQTNGSYRSRQTGNWNQVTTWQVFNGSVWNNLESVAAGAFRNVLPSNASGVISISSNTMVTIPAAVEITADQVEFGSTLAILQVASQGILNIFNGSGHDLRLYNDGVNFSQLLVSGILRLRNNATIINDDYTGTVVSPSDPTTANTYKVLNGGGHVHNSSDAIPYADWQVGSTFVFYATNTNPNLDNPSIPFHNFTWEGAPQSISMNLDGRLRNVNGNFRVNTTNGRTLLLSTTSDYTLDIAGNFVVLGNSAVTLNSTATTVVNIGTIAVPGNLQIANGSLNFTVSGNTTVNVSGDVLISAGTMSLRNTTTLPGASDLNINGNFSQTGGIVRRTGTAGSANINFIGAGTTSSFTKTGGSIINAVNFTNATGKTLNLGTSALSGTGSLTLVTGSILSVRSLDAGGSIQNNTTGGNIRLSGARSYQAGSTIIYDGAGPQFIGSGHPAAANTTINNVDNVSLASNVTINGTLNQIEGVLLIGGNTLTLGGPYLRTNGYFGITTLSNVIINGIGDFGDLILSPVQFTDNPMNNLTLNRAGTVFLGSSLIIGGAFNHTSGTFNLGEFNAFTLTLRGNFTQSGGATLAVYPGTSLVVEGTGSLPANVTLVGTDFSTLTMDRPSTTFNSTSPMTLLNLNLFNGTINNAALNITMAPNGLVTRQSGGSITSVLGALSTFDVIYNIDADVSTGNELPFDLTRLGNLIKQGPATLELTHPIQVNKSFTVTAGSFDIGTTNNVSIKEDLTVTGTLLSGESKVSFNGSTPQTFSSVSPMTLFDLELNQTIGSSLTLTLTDRLEIQNSLAVNSASTLNAGTNQLILLSTPTRTANVNPLATGASITGSIIVQRYLPKVVQRKQFHYIASPVTGSTLSDWTAELPIGVSYRWDEPTQRWQTINTATAMTNGRGFLIYVDDTQPRTFDSRGPLAQGTINVPLTRQATVGNNRGMNLVGNPYASAIHWDNITVPPNVDNAVYLVDNFGNSNQSAGTQIVVSYVDGVGTPAGYSGAIAQGQGFYVYATANSTLTFTESAKIVPTNTQFIRKADIPSVLRITLNGDDSKDETVIRLREGASDEFDGRFDAHKLLREIPTISSITADDVKAVINAFETPRDYKIVPLHLDSVFVGNYSISFEGIESFEPSINISLVDLVEKTSIDVKKQKEYSFTVSGQNFNLVSTRFKIVIGENELPIENVIAAIGTPSKNAALEEDVTVTVFPNPTTDKVVIKAKTLNNNVTAKLVNAQGIELVSKELLGDMIKEAEFELGSYADGIYNIRVLDGQNVVIKKIAKIK